PVDLKDETGNTLTNIAAQNGHKSIIKALLRRGGGLNTQNHNGQTPLHFCFTYGFTDLGNYLISKGADDTVQNFAGLTCYEGLGD
ncbi:ankyrin repeat-containing domain protein, partial [Baffinella frigidus]